MVQNFRITVIFDTDWIKANPTAVSHLHACLQDQLLSVALKKNSPQGCVIDVVGQDKPDVDDALNAAFDEIGAQSHVKLQQIKPIGQPRQSHEPTDAPDDGHGDGTETKEAENPTANIDQLVGCEELKALAQELSTLAPHIRRHRTWDRLSKRCYLFSLEDGCGFSAQIKLLSELFDTLGLGNWGSHINEYPWDMPLDIMLEQTAQNQDCPLISYDLREWLGKENDPMFRLFLRKIQQIQEDRIYIFRIPFVDKTTWRRCYETLSDLFPLASVSTPPFTMEQLHQYAQHQAKLSGFTLSSEAWEGMEQHLMAEKSDGRFWGFKTVQKVLEGFLYQKHLHDAKADTPPDQVDMTLGVKSIPPLLRPTLHRPAMAQFDDLLGMDAIRQQVLEMVTQMKLSRNTQGVDTPCLHMRFVGNPGTGKTTVARIVGQLLKEENLLSKGHFFEVGGRDLCGRYVGETAPKTAAICRDAYGSILFIDEAYALYRGDDGKDYGREAIDTLIAQMENHKEDLVVIMAGYEAEMDTLLKANPGLASRVPYTIEFPNYSHETLSAIFMSMVQKSFAYAPELPQVVQAYFAQLSQDRLTDPSFANARFVRNLFERTWGKASVRQQVEPDKPLVLCPCDFQQAAAQREFQVLQEKSARRTIGFAN